MLLVLVAAAACDLGGISREAAIELAMPHGGGGAEAVSAEHGPLGRFAAARTLPEEPRNREVWAVRVRGRVAVSCPQPVAGAGRCPPDSVITTLVVLDFRTGAFLYSEAPAP
jgi:hypothetical protein